MPNPVSHPGQLLVMELLVRDWTLTELANKLDMDRMALADFLNTHADITPELAHKIAAVTGISAQMWLNLQANFDAAEIVAQQAGSPVSVG